MGQLQVQLLKWADVAKKQSFQQKDDFTRRFSSFQTLVFSCVSNMAASDLLAEVFARFSTCFRIFLADTASYLALRKSSSNPPKKGPPPFWSSYGCCSCWTPVNSPIARKGSGNLPIISRVWDSEGFLNPSVCWFFRNISETLRAQHLSNLDPCFFGAFFYRFGGCEVGLLDRHRKEWLIILQVFFKPWPNLIPQTLGWSLSRLLKGHVNSPSPKQVTSRIARLKWFKQASLLASESLFFGTKPWCSLRSQDQASQGPTRCFSFWMIRFFTRKNGESRKVVKQPTQNSGWTSRIYLVKFSIRFIVILYWLY